MNLRTFLKLLPVGFLGAPALAKTEPNTKPPVREFPMKPEEMIGLWVQDWDYDRKGWRNPPYLVIREFDEIRDNPYQGMDIYNCRRNKFWGQKMGSSENTLLCIDGWGYSIRFFKNEPNTDWSLIGKGIIW